MINNKSRAITYIYIYIYYIDFSFFLKFIYKKGINEFILTRVYESLRKNFLV